MGHGYFERSILSLFWFKTYDFIITKSWPHGYKLSSKNHQLQKEYCEICSYIHLKMAQFLIRRVS